MTVAELYQELNERIPPSLSCEWDNDGMMCCPDRGREVRRVLVALDVTGDVVQVATEQNYDVILSHHPFIFKGLKNLDEENFIPAKAIKLIGAGISVMSFHTRLDAVEGGVNDVLADVLGLSELSCFGEGNMGRIGMLQKTLTPQDFAAFVRNRLEVPFVLLADAGIPVRRVAVLGGEGGGDIFAARAAGADAYVSGRLGYHNMTDAPDLGISLIEAGHFYTENPVCAALRAMVLAICPGVSCELYNSGRIKAI